MPHLPNELWNMIFSHLEFQEVFSARAINRQIRCVALEYIYHQYIRAIPLTIEIPDRGSVGMHEPGFNPQTCCMILEFDAGVGDFAARIRDGGQSGWMDTHYGQGLWINFNKTVICHLRMGFEKTHGRLVLVFAEWGNLWTFVPDSRRKFGFYGKEDLLKAGWKVVQFPEQNTWQVCVPVSQAAASCWRRDPHCLSQIDYLMRIKIEHG